METSSNDPREPISLLGGERESSGVRGDEAIVAEDGSSLLDGCLAALLAHLTRLTDREPGEREVPEVSPLEGLALPERLQQICQWFGLSNFERDLLFLVAASVIDGRISRRLQTLNQGSPGVSFDLASEILPESTISALAPHGPLRFYRILFIDDGRLPIGPSAFPISAPLAIDERILGRILGTDNISEGLRGFVVPIRQEETLATSHARLAGWLARTWFGAVNRGTLPVICLAGDSLISQRQILAAICRVHKLPLYSLEGRALAIGSREQEEISLLWRRESMLTNCVLSIDCHGIDPILPEAAAVWSFIARTKGYVAICAEVPWRSPWLPSLVVPVERPSTAEQHELWVEICRDQTGLELDGDTAARLSTWFDLDVAAIRGTSAAFHGRLRKEEREDHERWFTLLSEECRIQARRDFAGLARRVAVRATRDQICLTEETASRLDEIAAQARYRHLVHETWGLAEKSSRGLGISALFAGPSGTGKTMAAEVLADELGLDLFVVDLSMLIDKYVGETQKNLAKVFDAAEAGGCILLFDEADAMFGKRVQGNDGMDRHANNEISFLLHKMETFRGISILTSNLRDALDTAFMRRLRFVVDFPFPDQEVRRRIWQTAIPESAPVGYLDFDKLAALDVAGGNIRNIVVNSLFRAAEEGTPLSMHHIAHAASAEYEKLAKLTSSPELRTITDPES